VSTNPFSSAFLHAGDDPLRPQGARGLDDIGRAGRPAVILVRRVPRTIAADDQVLAQVDFSG